MKLVEAVQAKTTALEPHERMSCLFICSVIMKLEAH